MLAVRRSSQEAARLLARGVASWSKFDPAAMSGTDPAKVSNLGERGRRWCCRRQGPPPLPAAACHLPPAACQP